MADVTIDPNANANANHRDIRSFMTEKGKSEDKLLGLNKIFLEIKKNWGLRTAKQWFEQEFSKGRFRPVVLRTQYQMVRQQLLYSDDVGILSNCCRLLSETKKLNAFINSIGGTALSVGSCRVSTINLARIAYESKFNQKKYLEILRDRTELNCKALYSMRHILKRNIEKGLLPNYQNGAVEFDKQF